MKIISHTPRKLSTLRTFDLAKFQITLTCQSGLESLVKRESERIGLENMSGQDRLVSGTGNLRKLYELLVGSRFASRVYIEVAKERVADFDTLHDTLTGISWRDYLSGKELIVVEASSTRSILSSTPTIQSVAQKAIFSTLHTPNNANALEVHILILIVDDIARILLDVTGYPLHKRGYREESGEAPIKESLAAALIAFSNWKYRSPLIDPFCWSGTIAIEAALMARNIAPGIERHYRIESLPFHDREEYISVKNTLRLKAYPSGAYHIFASDIDPHMIEIARRNAERAWVAGDITFSVRNFLESPDEAYAEKMIITNPPYGKRLESDDLDEIYEKLITQIEEHGGGCITSYPVKTSLANKKLLNWSEECRYWYKKS